MFEDYFRQYALLIIFAAAAVSVPVGMMMMSFMAQSIGVRPSRPSAVKESAYEGGMPPFGGRPARFNFRYYYSVRGVAFFTNPGKANPNHLFPILLGTVIAVPMRGDSTARGIYCQTTYA